MNTKTILVPFSGHDKELTALDYAFSLAEIFEAHIEVWHVSPDPSEMIMPYSPYGALALPKEMVEKIEKSSIENRKDAENKTNLLAESLQFYKYSFHSAKGQAGTTLAVQGRVTDLVILNRSEENIDLMNIGASVLNGSGRPVVFVPPSEKKHAFNGKAVIAWNGSREAARAVGFAVPYFQKGEVWILSQRESEKRTFPLSEKDLEVYLQRQGIRTHVLADFTVEASIGASILNTAKTIEAGMIVMGAWGHNRLREFIFGGVTEFMLHEADLPVFMAR